MYNGPIYSTSHWAGSPSFPGPCFMHGRTILLEIAAAAEKDRRDVFRFTSPEINKIPIKSRLFSSSFFFLARDSILLTDPTRTPSRKIIRELLALGVAVRQILRGQIRRLGKTLRLGRILSYSKREGKDGQERALLGQRPAGSASGAVQWGNVPSALPRRYSLVQLSIACPSLVTSPDARFSLY